MGTFFENLTIGLHDAISMEKGEIQMIKKSDSPAPTYVAAEIDGITGDNHS